VKNLSEKTILKGGKKPIKPNFLLDNDVKYGIIIYDIKIIFFIYNIYNIFLFAPPFSHHFGKKCLTFY